MSNSPKNLAVFGGVSLFAIGTWVAANGTKFFEAAQSGWGWLMLVASQMPASWASLLLGALVGISVMYAMRRWIPDPGHASQWNNTRMALIEAVSAAASFFTVVAQIDRADGVNDFYLMASALVVALTTSLLYRIIGAIGEVVKRRFKPTRGYDDEEGMQYPRAQGQDPARPADG